MNNWITHPVSQADMRAVQALGERVVSQTYLPLTSADYAASLLSRWWSEEYFRAVIGSPDYLLLLAEAEQGSTVGVVEAQMKDTRCVLWKLYVDADWHGKGIGTQLLNELEKRIPSQVDTLLTRFLSQNRSAGLFFRNRGFVFDRLEKDPLYSDWSYTWLRRDRGKDVAGSKTARQSSSQQHRQYASELGSIPIAIVTVSDSRTLETDSNGDYLSKQINAFGHRVSAHHIVRDEPDQIEAVLEHLCGSDARLIIFNGGTGISQRDTTFDVISRKLQKTLPGFGELFRMLSYEQVGAAAMLSRATAGVYRNKVIISLPGSPAAVQLGWEKLILPELQHLAWEIIR